MDERDLLRNLEFAVGMYLGADGDGREAWYERLREAHRDLYKFRMEKKYGQRQRR